jgi:folylpolyglutamate synthase/dihydropteroate synthase
MPETIVAALSSDKDAPAVLRALREGFPSARLIATRSRSERALAPDVLARHATAAGFDAEALPDVGVALRAALERSSGVVLLAGSLFAVGEAMEIFGGAPGEML